MRFLDNKKYIKYDQTNPLICSDQMQFCPNPKILYGAGQPVCILKKKGWFGLHYSSPDGFDAPHTERFMSLHVHSINWFLQHFHWGLAFF